MKIVLIGPQGCGKGTIGDMLSAKLHIPVVSVGDVLRHLTPQSPYYKKINEYMEKGELAPNDITAKILINTLSSDTYSKGFILDGWLRQMDDVVQFDPHPDLLIVLNISRQTSIKRIAGRRICVTDGKTYNIHTLPADELERCKGDLVQRPDDTQEAVNRRLDIYYTKTVEVINSYKKRGIVMEVDAEPEPKIIFDNILKKLKIL